MNKYKILTLLFLLSTGVKSNASHSSFFIENDTGVTPNADSREVRDTSSPNETDQTQTDFKTLVESLDVSEKIRIIIMMTIIENNETNFDTLTNGGTPEQAEKILMDLIQEVMKEAQKKGDIETYNIANQLYLNQQFIELSKIEDAAGTNIVELKKLLKEGVKVDTKGIGERTALYYALKLGNDKTQQFLVNNGASDLHAEIIIENENRFYNTNTKIFGIPALWLSKHLNVAYTLVSLKTDINPLTQEKLNKNFIYTAQDDSYLRIHSSSTPVFLSLLLNLPKKELATREKKHFQTLKSLLDQGAKVNAQDFNRRTALHYAAENGNLKKVQFLVNNGAYIFIEDKEGKKPSDLASDVDVENFLKELEKKFPPKKEPCRGTFAKKV